MPRAVLPIRRPMRRGALILGLLVALTLPAGAHASELIARDAKDITLRVNARGQALVGYRAKGRTWSVLAWGAMNARHPTEGRPQVQFTLDYSGGWRSQGRVLARRFVNACGRYAGPALTWLVTGCTMPDGSHWALQAWQRGLPESRSRPVEAPAERLGAPPQPLARRAAQARALDELGLQQAVPPRLRPPHVPRTARLRDALHDEGGAARRVRPECVPRHAQLGVRAGLAAENSFLSHKATGAFCYGFYPHDPYPGYPATGKRPEGKGERYRATVVGPGVLPDVTWEGAAPAAYDAVLDRQLTDLQRALYGESARCKPL